MRTPYALALALALLVSIVAGCSNEPAAPTGDTNAVTVQGAIGDSDFEVTFNRAGDPADPLEGPFVLRGSNVQYDDSLTMLSVDLTISNHGIVAHPEPVGLTFLKLLPPGVTVLNPDNGVNGDGAAIVFAFANDDGSWTPQETSLPRTVQFGVARGVSIGFIARLDISDSPTEGGSISGRAWNDANKDGVVDPDEQGLPGVLIVLRSISEGATPKTRETWRTVTGPDGTYEFSGLAAGVYVVSKALATPHFFPTTPTEITVVLVENDGVVSGFTGADFGCVPMNGPPPLGLGVHLKAVGEFSASPEPHLFARGLDIAICGFDTLPTPLASGDDDDDDDDHDGDHNDGDDDDDDCTISRLRGPVTSLDESAGIVEVMGVAIRFDEFPTEVEVGTRLDVRVERAENDGSWVATRWKRWHGTPEQVEGRVDDIAIDNTSITRVFVTGLWVVLPHR